MTTSSFPERLSSSWSSVSASSVDTLRSLVDFVRLDLFSWLKLSSPFYKLNNIDLAIEFSEQNSNLKKNYHWFFFKKIFILLFVGGFVGLFR
jgi:hypothetical protein